MPSYAGQDTGYVPANFETMVFAPSTGGSHNPKESTTRECIEYSALVLEDTCKQLLRQPFRNQLRPEADRNLKVLIPESKTKNKKAKKKEATTR